jgi:4-amino-4-deoxy-L-arabinose transferase-like glycosyltransferase
LNPYLERHALTLVILIALFARIALLIVGKTYIFPENWPGAYETGNIAAAIAETGTFASPFGADTGPTAWMMPGYPFLLALIFKVFGTYSVSSATVALLLDCIASALTLIPVFLMTNQLYDRKAALLAAAIFCLYPPSLWHATGRIWDTTFFTMLALFLLNFLMTIEKTWTLKTAMLAGLFFGIIAIFKVIILALYPFVFIRILLQKSVFLNVRLQQIGLLTLMILLVLSPWMWRNYHIFGRPLLRSNFGLELKLGNNSGGKAYMQTHGRGKIEMHHPIIKKEELEKYRNMGELAYTASAGNEALVFIRKHPYDFVQLTIQRFLYFWVRDLDLSKGLKGYFGIRSKKSAFTTVIYILPLPFMLLGMVVALRNQRPAGVLISYLILFPLVYYITHVRQRYRFPVEPVMLIFAAGGLAASVKFLFRGGQRKPALPT